MPRAALKSYRDSLAISESLAKNDPSNSGLQKDVSLAYEVLGDTAKAIGGSKNFEGAREWYGKATEHGDVNAMTKLGALCDNGEGTTPDFACARDWYSKAVDRGDTTARVRLDKLPIHEAAHAGHYPEALQLMRSLALQEEASETQREGRPGRETGLALTATAWYALLAKDVVAGT